MFKSRTLLSFNRVRKHPHHLKPSEATTGRKAEAEAMMENSNVRLHKKMHINKNEHLQWMNMSLPSIQHEKEHQGSFSKNEAIIKDSDKRMEDEGSKYGSLCMCLPGFGFGRTKTVKARKGGIKMDHSVNTVMSTTFSLENFELDSGVTPGKGIIMQENNNHEDDSFSSYFDLPSIILKCSGDDA